MIRHITEMNRTNDTGKVWKLDCELLMCSVNPISRPGKLEISILFPIAFFQLRLHDSHSPIQLEIRMCFLRNLLRMCCNAYYKIYSNTMKPSEQISQDGKTIFEPKAGNIGK